MFWGIMFLAIGIVVIIQTIFKIDLPVLKILFGVFLIYMGLKVIFGSFGLSVKGFQVEQISTETQSVFSNSEFKSRQADGSINKKFSTAFGNSVLDLSDLSEEELSKEIQISNGFGKTLVKTNPAIAIKAQVAAGFASVKIRDQKVGVVGETDIQTPGWSADKPHYKLKIETGFGEVTVL